MGRGPRGAGEDKHLWFEGLKRGTGSKVSEPDRDKLEWHAGDKGARSQPERSPATNLKQVAAPRALCIPMSCPALRPPATRRQASFGSPGGGNQHIQEERVR